MPALLEYEAKILLRAGGIAVPRAVLVDTGEAAESVAKTMGRPVWIKAQTLFGNRLKLGLVTKATSPEACRKMAEAYLRGTAQGFPIRKVLVEEDVPHHSEYFCAILYDFRCRSPILLFSTRGGADVEDQLRDSAQSHRLTLSAREALTLNRIVPFLELAEVPRGDLQALARGLVALHGLFLKYYLTLLEVNPLVVTANRELVAIDLHIYVDDQSLFSTRELLEDLGITLAAEAALTPLEQEILAIDRSDPNGAIRFREFPDGDVGFLIMGGGGSLYCQDRLMEMGMKPANYFDMTTGQQMEEKMYGVTRALLRGRRLKGLLVGSNISALSEVQMKVRGVMRALRDEKVDPHAFPVVIRLAGHGEEEAAEAAAELPGIEYFRDDITMDSMVERFCRRIKKCG